MDGHSARMFLDHGLEQTNDQAVCSAVDAVRARAAEARPRVGSAVQGEPCQRLSRVSTQCRKLATRFLMFAIPRVFPASGMSDYPPLLSMADRIYVGRVDAVEGPTAQTEAPPRRFDRDWSS